MQDHNQRRHRERPHSLSYAFIYLAGVTPLIGACISTDAPALDLPPTQEVRYAEELHGRLERLRATYQLPSLSLAIAVEDAVRYRGAVGFADVESATPATSRTVYSVGSLAKPMTALAMMKLVESKQLELDRSARNYVPAFPEKAHDFTVRQLASHTAGITHSNMGRMRKEWFDPSDHGDPLEAIDYFEGAKLRFEPGSKFEYSSSGYVLLSAVIGAATGESYVDAMKRLVFYPLGMEQTEHDVSTAGTGLEAAYYRRAEEGVLVDAEEPRDRSFLFGGGGYLSTPTDLVRMGMALNSDRFLAEEFRSTMLTPVPLDDGTMNPQRYALGWRIEHSESHRLHGNPISAVHHGGTVSKAASAFLLVIPEHRASIAFATNAIPLAPDSSKSLRDDMWELLIWFLEVTRQDQILGSGEGVAPHVQSK